MLLVLALIACGDKEPDDSTLLADDSALSQDDTHDTHDTGASEGPLECGAVTEPAVPGTVPALRIQSSITWQLDFSEDAETNGFTDCSYTRDFEGVQVLDVDYLCPDCESITVGTATMQSGEDCFAQISTAGPVRQEVWGLSPDGRLFRTSRVGLALGELAAIEGLTEGESASVQWASVSDLTNGGTMDLLAAGTLSYTIDQSALLPEPFAARQTPYAAGWEQNNPGDLVMDYDLQVGSTFPNVRLQDQCGDAVDLWDFYGSYLILDTSQFDCGPCRSMAASEHDFLESIRAEGYPVRVLTLLGNGLSDPYSTPPASVVDDWALEYSVTEPLLYDRGFAYALFPDFITDYSGEGFGYPAWLVVDPEMKLVHGNVGFGGWDDVADVIRAHDAQR